MSLDERINLVDRKVAEFEETYDRDVRTVLRNPLKAVVVVVAVAFGIVGFLQPALFIFPQNLRYTVWLWSVSLVLYWLKEASETDTQWKRGTFVLFGVLGIAAGGYFIVNFHELRAIRPGIYYMRDFVAGGIAVALTIIAAYREFGLPLTVLALFSLFYAYFGYLFPGVFHHSGLGVRTLTAISVEFGGIFGTVSQAGARWIFVFMVFAGVLKAQGVLRRFLQVGAYSTRLVSTGVSQTAVISSLIVGSVSGSAVANTALTGSFTIPMMKRRGIEDRMAAAIESVASTGGQVMPPVMAIVAFIMADMLQVLYIDVVIMALLPGLLFYGTIAFSTHLIALEWAGDLEIATDEDTDDRFESVKESMDIEILPPRELVVRLLPVTSAMAFLVAILLVYRFNAAYAAFWTILVLMGVQYLVTLYLHRNDGLMTVGTQLVQDTINNVDGMYQGMMAMIPVMIIIAHLNIIIEVFNVTGFGNQLALLLVPVADANLLLFLVLLMGIVILIGMGAPTLPAYLLTLAVAVPALVEMGFRPEQAHFFVLYSAILSNFTPPVAQTVAVASNLADSDFLQSAVEACKIGIAGFLLPFAMVFNISLLHWSFPETLVTVVLVAAGLALMAMGMQRRSLWKPLGYKRAVASFAVGFALFALPPIVF